MGSGPQCTRLDVPGLHPCCPGRGVQGGALHGDRRDHPFPAGGEFRSHAPVGVGDRRGGVHGDPFALLHLRAGQQPRRGGETPPRAPSAAHRQTGGRESRLVLGSEFWPHPAGSLERHRQHPLPGGTPGRRLRQFPHQPAGQPRLPVLAGLALRRSTDRLLPADRGRGVCDQYDGAQEGIR